MEYWAKPRMARDQIVLFSPTLDASISDDHPVRLLDEILKGLDWSAWEAEYDGQKGQPPIPPWVMAGVILYGLMRGIRSSRMLEYLCGHNVDFMWLAEGRVIDHTTLCKFRTRFRGPLKELFRQLGKLSLQMGLIRLVEVAFDGTRVKANASRLRTWTAERLEAALKGDEQGPAWRDDGEPAGVPLCGLCGLRVGGRVPGSEGQARSDRSAGRVRTVAGKDGRENANAARQVRLQPAHARCGDAVRRHQEHFGRAAIFAAWLGEGADRMVVGMYRVQHEEVAGPRGGTVRRVGENVGRSGKLGEAGGFGRTKTDDTACLAAKSAIWGNSNL